MDMDINNRDEFYEKKEKQMKLLKESYKGIFKNAAKDLLNEDAFSVGKALKNANKPGKDSTKAIDSVANPTSHNAVHQLEEDAADGDPTPDEDADKKDPKVDDKMKGDAPVGDVAPKDVPPPAPVVAGTPEGGDVNSQDQMTTRTFVTTFMKGLPTDIDLQNSVDANGVFKASVNDQHNGQFVVVAFPATKTIHQVADLVEPQPAAAAGMSPDGTMPPAVPGTEVPPPVVPPVAGAVPPVAGASALPPVAGAEAAPPIEGEVPSEPVEEPVTEEKCMDQNCTDPNCSVHGMEAHQMKESERELQRDPLISGRKNWKTMIAKLLREGVEAKEKMEEEKWEQEAVKHPGAFKEYCDKAGFNGVCDECIAHAKKSNDAHVVKMATLAQTFRKQAGKMEESAAGDSVETLEKRVKNIEKQLEDETDAEEKESLKVDLGKAKMALARAKDTSNVVSDADKKKLAAEK